MGLFAKIKAIWAARKVVTQMGDIKRGWKTWKFWISLLGNIMALGLALKGLIPAMTALVAMTILTAGYNLLRGFEKIDEDNVKPVYQVTEFWLGIGTEIGKAVIALQGGGINPVWFSTLSAIVAAAMTIARDLAFKEPAPKENPQ